MTRYKEDVEIPYEVCNQFDETGKPYLLDKSVTDCQKLVIKVQNTEPAYCTFCYLDQFHNLNEFKTVRKNENDTYTDLAETYMLYGKDNSVEYGIEFYEPIDIYGIYVRPSANGTILTDSKVEIIEAVTK